MLHDVHIENFRGFKSFGLTGLSQVNLLVGKNNSGKTALLEGIHFLASGGDPDVLMEAARRRGEFVFGSREEPALADVSHLFYGHDISEGATFTIRTNNAVTPVEVSAVPVDDVQPDLFGTVRGMHRHISKAPAFALRIKGQHPRSEDGHIFFLSEDGALLVDPDRRPRWHRTDRLREGPPIVFISPDSIAPASLGGMWNRVLQDKQESEVRSAMQILESDLEDIVFQTGDSLYRPYYGRSGVLVSFKGDRKRVPLGSMGDGMRRLLALSISLIHAKDGYLIIDEIDTGFHYSIMADMWALVVKTAANANIQVFATTHSFDCVRGLGVLSKREPDLRDCVALHKIERDISQNVAFTGEEVVNAVEQEIEMR
jgi:hypothetical protein